MPRSRKIQASPLCTPGLPVSVDKKADGGAEIKATPEAFAAVGGSTWDAFNLVILRETLGTVWIPGNEQDGQTNRIQAAMAALKAFKPRDEIEGMLAAQTVALHFGAMECFRRSMHPEQPGEVASKLRRDGANLARAMADMLDALDRKRGKRPQVVRVERVVVQDGGKAIVGNVSQGPGAEPPLAALEAAEPTPALPTPRAVESVLVPVSRRRGDA